MATVSSALIIGYGEMGHAFEHLLQGECHLDIWQRHQTENASALKELAATSDFIFYCVPAKALEELATRVQPVLSGNSISLCISKGLDDKGRPAVQIFNEIYGTRSIYGVIYGPMISEEIRANRPGFAQLGIDTKTHYEQVASLFSKTSLYLEHSHDLIGISWACILKNIYAILFGIADALELGDNMRGYLSVAALQEMQSVVMTLGGKAGTCQKLAGLGDLITTATSEGSHHHGLGQKLVRGELDNIKGEGVHTLEMIRKFSMFDINQFPMMALVQQCIESPANIDSNINSYLDTVYQLTN